MEGEKGGKEEGREHKMNIKKERKKEEENEEEENKEVTHPGRKCHVNRQLNVQVAKYSNSVF